MDKTDGKKITNFKKVLKNSRKEGKKVKWKKKREIKSNLKNSGCVWEWQSTWAQCVYDGKHIYP